ncbi:CinA family protein [Jeongeupia chitinilytica]|uniref:Competence damage-inducible protein A n=1 Tax=Jeongeupia chitinilytica TaxID=1041641 RepID=A0ABQ3GW20_9NEIS|nr:nicotinamide-nucleotide amidohydrolase family protein [Jeongeupia chitinilytica]GHD58014.1 competence damage-inducible protein A [Jeongeupia chitinilytica]
MLNTEALAVELGRLLLARGHSVTTAESCTGGLIAGAITDIAGSSNWFNRGFVTYSNSAKVDMLDVPPAFIQGLGAVSEPVVAAMVQGAMAAASAEWGVAVSGIAGPGGGSEDKPVGTVWFAFGSPLGIVTERCVFGGDRAAVRRQAVAHALDKLVQLIKESR